MILYTRIYVIDETHGNGKYHVVAVAYAYIYLYAQYWDIVYHIVEYLLHNIPYI